MKARNDLVPSVLSLLYILLPSPTATTGNDIFIFHCRIFFGQFDISACTHWYYLCAFFFSYDLCSASSFKYCEKWESKELQLVWILTLPLTCSVTLGKSLFFSEYLFHFHVYKKGTGLKLEISNWLPTGHIWYADIILFGSYFVKLKKKQISFQSEKKMRNFTQQLDFQLLLKN